MAGWRPRAVHSRPKVMWTLLPVEGSPAGRLVPNIESALAAVTSHMQAKSATAHRERVDLAALHKHTGELYAQVESIPADVYSRVRNLQGVAPIVLLPPVSGGPAAARASAVGNDAVVMFADAHGSLKGLPKNQRATMVLKACGMERIGEVRGDVFFGRLSPAASSASGIALGPELAPPFIMMREWLEAGQAANKAGTNAHSEAFQKTIVDALAAIKRQQIANAVAATGAAPAAASPGASSGAAAAKTTAAATAAATTAAATAGVAAIDVTDGVSAAFTGSKDESGGAPAAANVGGSASSSDSEAIGKYTWFDGWQKGTETLKEGWISGWSGTEVQVTFVVPAGTKPRNVACVLKDNHIKVEVCFPRWSPSSSAQNIPSTRSTRSMSERNGRSSSYQLERGCVPYAHCHRCQSKI